MASTTDDVEQQLRQIRDEVSIDPLLSEREALSLTCRLATEFQHDDAYYGQVLSLFNNDVEEASDGKNGSGARLLYKAIRYARRDGNCFYRCVSFRLFELMLGDAAYAQFCLLRVQSVEKSMLAQFGEYSTDFSDVVKNVIEGILSGSISSVDDIYRVVLSEEASYLMVFFRYAVSVYLREHRDDFLPFVMGLDYPSVEDYCSAEVEPVDHESDNVQLVGFAKLFHVVMNVEALDRTTSGRTTTHMINSGREAPEAKRPKHTVYLLFRPGHYDLLETN